MIIRNHPIVGLRLSSARLLPRSAEGRLLPKGRKKGQQTIAQGD